MSEVLVLSEKEIRKIFNIETAVTAVEKAYTEKSSGTGRVWPMIFQEFDPGHADMDIKSGDLASEGIFGLKLVSWFENNENIGKPALYGTVLVFDRSTGEPKALLNGGALTDLRTGAAGAVGIKYLARENAETALMAGCGELAPYLIAAALLVRPDIKKMILVNPHHPEKAAEKLDTIAAKVDKLLQECGKKRAAVIEAYDDIEKGVRESDIIMTATPSREAFIKKEWIKPGTHISCVGADMSGKQEIDEKILADALVAGDDQKQCSEVGECEKACKSGLISGLDAEIGEIITGKRSGRASDAQITVFDSTGIALQDLASAAAVIEKAEKAGAGIKVEL